MESINGSLTVFSLAGLKSLNILRVLGLAMMIFDYQLPFVFLTIITRGKINRSLVNNREKSD